MTSDNDNGEKDPRERSLGRDFARMLLWLAAALLLTFCPWFQFPTWIVIAVWVVFALWAGWLAGFLIFAITEIRKRKRGERPIDDDNIPIV